MRQSLIFLLVGLGGGFAIAAFWEWQSEDSAIAGDIPENASPANRVVDIEARLAEQERRNSELAATLDTLREEISYLHSALDAGSPDAESTARTNESSSAISRESDSAEAGREVASQPRSRRQRIDPITQLTDAGFTLEKAQAIERRIEELRVAAMQERYDALRSGEPGAAQIQNLRDTATALRDELGDQDYERYLSATGRPTSVGVTTVLASSAAESAGIQTGDEVVAYGGERVFNSRDLNRVLLEGEPGEGVIVDVIRDGQAMQLVLPRGPLGITSGFDRRLGR